MSAVPDLRYWPTAELRDAVLSSVLLAADPFAQEAAVDYWDMSAVAHMGVISGIQQHGAPDVVLALEAVLLAPDDPAKVSKLARLVARDAQGESPEWTQIGAQALRADGLGRLAAHLGTEYRAGGAAVTVADLIALTLSKQRAVPAVLAAPVCIIVPFRDRTATRSRLRNLLACLRAVEDQSVERESYRVVVVEADDEPRWRSLLAPVVDEYVHLTSPGHFNKAWAVNVGVVQCAGGAELLCVLDADVLVDQQFIERNIARFEVRGAQAHLPFRDALCLDDASSHYAITERVLERRPEISLASVRGVVLRRPPGHCVWVRRGLFERVGGFDERFEGWGGEDLDLVFRLEVVGAVDRYPDSLLHLHHERPQTHENGRRFYAGRRLLSWRPDGPIGQPERPATSQDDDLAGLIERVDDCPAILQ